MNLTFDFRTWGVSFDAHHDWHPFLDRESTWNWVDFTLIKLGFEHSPYKSSKEVFGALLGFHLTVTIWTTTDPRKGPWLKIRRYDRETGDEVTLFPKS